VSYDPDNHHRMMLLRAEKVARIARDIPKTEVYGDERGDLLILGWGSTYGSIRSAVERLRARGKRVAHAHLRYVNPLPEDLGEILSRYERVLMPELNLGQLRMLVRSKYLVDAVGFNLVRGKPFQIGEIEAKAESLLGESVEGSK
ncbi:MAG: 2-oxoglutarate oxidoreductase subunit KorA, partial [Chloroflexota bacterium]